MKPIYLDNNSTTMLDPRVLDKMVTMLKENYGNPSSTEHEYGWVANEAINNSREKIGNLINCSPNEIFFTSGATESNNISIQGVISNYKNTHAITVKTEHKSVLDVFLQAEKKGADITYLNVSQDGSINIDQLYNSINSNTKLISVMMANNEIGVLHPIKEIGELCKKNNIIFHVDAAQAIGKIDVNIKEMSVDLLSISSHKVYGPKGVGCIYIDSRTMKNKVSPLVFGGAQELGIRPGTLASANIVGFGEACKITKNEIREDMSHIQSLTDHLLYRITSEISDTILNGNKKQRIPGNLNLTFMGLNDIPLIQKLKNIAVSSGSACTSSSPSPSHVLSAIGLSKELIRSTIRIGIGKFNTQEDIEYAANYIIRTINKLRVDKKGV